MADMTTPARRYSGGARVCTILAFVFAVVAILFLPILFGPAAIILGVVGGSMGDRPLGWYAAGAGAVGMILGFVLAAVLINSH
jgi:hypothetical protein